MHQAFFFSHVMPARSTVFYRVVTFGSTVRCRAISVRLSVLLFETLSFLLEVLTFAGKVSFEAYMRWKAQLFMDFVAARIETVNVFVPVQQPDAVGRKAESEHAKHIQLIVGQVGMCPAQVLYQPVTALIDHIAQVGKSLVVAAYGVRESFETLDEQLRFACVIGKIEQGLEPLQLVFERREQCGLPALKIGYPMRELEQTCFGQAIIFL